MFPIAENIAIKIQDRSFAMIIDEKAHNEFLEQQFNVYNFYKKYGVKMKKLTSANNLLLKIIFLNI